MDIRAADSFSLDMRYGIEEKRRVRVLCLSGEKIDIPSDSLKVVDGVEVDEDDAGVA